MLAQFCAVLLFLWTPVSARIIALVFQLYEQNKLKLKMKIFLLSFSFFISLHGELAATVLVAMGRIAHAP